MAKKRKKERIKVMFIVNPKSGKRRPYFSAGKIADMFAQNNMEVAVYFTAPGYKADFLVKEHINEFDIVACCGGDGTISEAISGMMECGANKPLGYVPAGTTNDLARSLNITTNMSKAAKAIITGKPQPLDVGSFDDDYFIYIASFGAFTEVSYATSQKAKNLFGRLAYIFGAVKYMHTIKSYHLKVNTDTIDTEGDYIFGALTNSTSVAGIFKFENEFVDFADGQYEVMLIRRPDNIFTAFAICMSMLNKTYGHKNIELFKASEIEFISEDPLDWAVDGEHKQGGNVVHIKNNPQAIHLIAKNHGWSPPPVES